jgi:hypothetical protein
LLCQVKDFNSKLFTIKYIKSEEENGIPVVENTGKYPGGNKKDVN